MPETWNKLDTTQTPTKEIIAAYINNPLWERLCNHIEGQYEIKPIFEYSGCSMQAGWNIKYKKSNRNLCTLYPMEGYFIALIVIGERERTETEFALPFFTEHFQHLYQETKTGMGQKWLMINVTDDDILNDVIKCIEVRRVAKGNRRV